MRKEGEEALGLAILGSGVDCIPKVLAGLQLLPVGSRGAAAAAAAAGVRSSRCCLASPPWPQPLPEKVVKGLVPPIGD